MSVSSYISIMGKNVASVEIADKVSELWVKEGARALGEWL